MFCVFCYVPLAATGLAVRVEHALCNVALDSLHRHREAAAETLIAIRRGELQFSDLHEPGVDVTLPLADQIERSLRLSGYRYEGRYTMADILARWDIDPRYAQALRRYLDVAVDDSGRSVAQAVEDWLA